MLITYLLILLLSFLKAQAKISNWAEELITKTANAEDSVFTEGNTTDSAKQFKSKWEPGLPWELAVKLPASFSFWSLYCLWQTKK